MDYLMNNIRNEVISYQSFISKTVESSTKKLTLRLLDLKRNLKDNFNEISELELKLREISDLKISSILEKNVNFDTLHSERITPFF
jgi:hypothetical protein